MVLGPCASTAGHRGSTPGPVTKDPSRHVMQPKKKKGF